MFKTVLSAGATALLLIAIPANAQTNPAAEEARRKCGHYQLTKGDNDMRWLACVSNIYNKFGVESDKVEQAEAILTEQRGQAPASDPMVAR
jgi:hypothetical protein